MALIPSPLAPEANEIFWRYDVAIKPGRREAFEAVAKRLWSIMDAEPGTLGYRYFISPDGATCHIFEHYRDSDGLVAHADAFTSDLSEAFLDACEPQAFHVYGSPTEAVKASLARYGAIFFSALDAK